MIAPHLSLIDRIRIGAITCPRTATRRISSATAEGAVVLEKTCNLPIPDIYANAGGRSALRMEEDPVPHPFDRMQRRAATTKVAAPSWREEYLPAGHHLGKDAAPGDQSRAGAVALDDPKQQAAAQPCHQDAVPLDQARPQHDADRRARFR